MITIYGKPDCTRCKRAKMICEKKNVPFEYVDLDTVDGLAMGAMAEVLDCTLPVIEVDGERVDYDTFIEGVS